MTRSRDRMNVLERLYQAYRLYSPVDPEATENRKTINMAFVSQSAPDIRKKLQELEGLEGKVISKLVEIAQRLFQSGDSPAVIQGKEIAKVLVAAWGRPPNHNKGMGKPQPQQKRPRSTLGKNQCLHIAKKRDTGKMSAPRKSQNLPARLPFWSPRNNDVPTAPLFP